MSTAKNSQGIHHDEEEITKLRIEYVKHLPIDESVPAVKREAVQRPAVQRPVAAAEGKGDAKLVGEPEEPTQPPNIFLKHSYLVGGDMICCSNNLTSDDKKVVIETLLFCELAANYKYRPEGGETYSASKWFEYYGETLNKLAWPTTLSTSFDDHIFNFHPNKPYLSEMSSIVIDEISERTKSEIFTDNLTALFEALLNEDKGSKLMAFLISAHSQVRNDLFLVGVADLDQDVPSILLLAIEIKVDVHNVFKLHADIKVATLRVVLNRVVFNKIQGQVEKKLGNALKTNVLPVE